MELVILDVLRGVWPRELRLGASAGDVLAVLGPTPTYVARSRRDSRVAILKYGDIELHFGDAGLWLMHSDSFEHLPRGEGSLTVDAAWLRRGAPLADVKGRLTDAGIAWVEHAAASPDCVALHVPPHGTLLFRVDDEGSSLIAISARVAPTRP